MHISERKSVISKTYELSGSEKKEEGDGRAGVAK
jgi:hypothetical protein